MWVLGMELRSSGLEASVLTYWVVSSSLILHLLRHCFTQSFTPTAVSTPRERGLCAINLFLLQCFIMLRLGQNTLALVTIPPSLALSHPCVQAFSLCVPWNHWGDSEKYSASAYRDSNLIASGGIQEMVFLNVPQTIWRTPKVNFWARVKCRLWKLEFWV